MADDSGPGERHELLAAAADVLPDVVRVRRELHRHPEIGLQLPESQRVVVRELEALGLTPVRGRGLSSVTAVVAGARPGPTILLRADMDGLPLQEDTGLGFASAVAGAMHACGHDTHVAMLLGAVRLLLARRDELGGRVLLMFQPGEEGYHGARLMLDEGLLDMVPDGPPDLAFAIHISTRYESGTINLRPGAQLASSDTIRVTVRGRGGHASTPHLAVDPVAVAAAIVTALQVAVARRIDVFDPAVVTIAHLLAGTTTNIIPETAFLEGTMRTVSAATRAALKEHVAAAVDGVAAAYGATVELEIEPGYPVTVNHALATDVVRQVASGLLGEARVTTMAAPVMGAEDFSYVLERVPGAFVFLGGAAPGSDLATVPQNHSNLVVFDEQAMVTGVALYAAVARHHLTAA